MGSVLAAIDSRHFESVWKGMDLGKDDSISLMSYQGDMLVRSPFLEKAISTNYKDRPLFRSLIPAKATGSYQDHSGVDGVERLFSYRTVSFAPDTVVVVGQTMSHALERWHSWVILVVATWLLGSLGAFC